MRATDDILIVIGEECVVYGVGAILLKRALPLNGVAEREVGLVGDEFPLAKDDERTSLLR